MRLTLTFILLTTMIDAIGISLILPIMPTLLRDVGGFALANAAFWGSLLTAVFAAMQFFFGPLLGALSDRFGRRPILLISLAVMALDYIVMALAHTYWLLLLGRIIGGITAATPATTAAVMADISTPEEKAVRFGLFGAAFGIGFILGPPLGGLLADFGTRAPFYAAAVLVGATGVLGYFVMPETVTDKNRRAFSWRRANPIGAFRSVTLNPAMRKLLIVFFVYQVAFWVYPAIWAFYTEERFGWSPKVIGLSLGAFGIMMAIVQGGLIRIYLKWFGDRGTVIYGIVFNAIAFLFLALVTNGTLALLLTPLTALGAVVTPAIQGMMSKKTPDDSQGELQGVLASSNALAMGIGPPMMAYVFAKFAADDAPVYFPGAPFLVSMALMGVCMMIYLRAPKSLN
ncbi:MAG: TCR/Tet family MFS transporter [Paracoccaceae bacterium]